MFRLPTHLESLVPPPRDQVPQSLPWRGSIFLPASSPHPARPREIRVTAAEIENDNQQESWPRHFQLHVIRRRGVLQEVQHWVSQIAEFGGQLARCMFMPDRLTEQAASRENQALFESFARQLLEEETVAIAPWTVSGPSPPGGILLYPTTTTRALLVGVVFLNTGFPAFLQGSASPNGGAGASRTQNMTMYSRNQSGFQPSAFDPAPPNIASSSRYSSGGFDSSMGRSERNSS